MEGSGDVEDSEKESVEIDHKEDPKRQKSADSAEFVEVDLGDDLKRQKTMLETRAKRVGSTSKSKARYQKNQLYMGGLFIISMFYAVIVLHTAFNAQKMQYKTGNSLTMTFRTSLVSTRP